MAKAPTRPALLVATASLALLLVAAARPRPRPAPPEERQFQTLRLAIRDLTETFGERYPNGGEFLKRLEQRQGDFQALKRQALLANPLLDFDRLLVVKRKVGKDPYKIGIPANGSSNSELASQRFDNEIAVLTMPKPGRPPEGGTTNGGKLTTLCRPPTGGYVGEVDLHWEGNRLLFSQSDLRRFALWEVRADGSGLRQVSQAPEDVDCYDACYLPDGGIVFGCTASYQSVPCWHGLMPACHLYRMDADGRNMRQLCFDQDLDVHASVLPNGQVLYNRWDYTGPNHIFQRQLMAMNPDGSGQRAVVGSNSWFPNALYFSRALPGEPSRFVSILSGYHGAPRMGQLVLVDARRGWHEADPLVLRISGRGDPIAPKIADNLVDDDWPKFLHPYPLSGKYFLVACLPDAKANWGICLADAFDNLLLLREEPGYALLEPVPLRRTPKPPALPDRIEPGRADATVYLHDVYAGRGLAGVPRGTVKTLRIIAYDFGYRGLAGPDRVGYGGPWEVMRILGTVPVEDDGSALFRVPACTPLAVQTLDAEGKAVQLMRSWFTAMPGEAVSCVGCHEPPPEAPAPGLALALRRPTAYGLRLTEIAPWHGPPRGFDFAREVQPVLDRHCVGCHDGTPGRPDLRSEEDGASARTWPTGYMERLHPLMKQGGWKPRFTSAYDALVRRIRRVGIEDDVSLLVPGELHADTSPLVQMLRKHHRGVDLEPEAWDRLVTWIDLNAPCHGTWGEVFSPIPDKAHERRRALRKLYGGPADDPEAIPRTSYEPRAASDEPFAALRTPHSALRTPECPAWPFDAAEAKRRQAAVGPAEQTIDLSGGITLELALIPAGEFLMGDPGGEPDEQPVARVAISEPFWLGATEVTNEQFRRFDPSHDSGYYSKRYARQDGQGLPLDGPKHPVARVSWEQAMAFCRWLSERTGRSFTLPTEAQWEWACRAGSASPLPYGQPDADFSPWANVADRQFSRGLMKGAQVTGGLPHFLLEGADCADARGDDGAVVTADVARYQPNPWGIHDMIGNVAEWTRSAYQPYPYREDDGRNHAIADRRLQIADLSKQSGMWNLESGIARRFVVRGGSFFDPPKRCRSAFRLAYPAWQRVFNVGFRVACPVKPAR